MTTLQEELLLMRLDSLYSDVDKVAGAVERAKQRGREIDAIVKVLGEGRGENVIRPLRQLSGLVDELGKVFRENAEIAENITDMEGPELLERLTRARDEFEVIYNRLIEARNQLVDIRKTIVPLDDRVLGQVGLAQQCRLLQDKVEKLRPKVRQPDLDGEQRRKLWQDYEQLLVTEGRPLFAEYVDFLGGLTVRDTGLDDRVSEMTDVLLSGFKSVTRHYLPIPSRQAALSSAMDSIVKVGFPEWTVWGMPLVAHEVGLALANVPDVQQFLEKWPIRPAAELCELFADAFASYTMGPAYGYAALLLRLQPHHDEPTRQDEARDVDRARLILGILRSLGGPETDYRRRVGRLRDIWESAVVTLAAPENAEQAAEDARGPLPALDWLDDFRDEILALFRYRGGMEAFDAERWSQAQDDWSSIVAGRAASTRQMPEEAGDVLAVLNIAWATRVDQPGLGNDIAAQVGSLWSKRKRTKRNGGR